MDWYTKMKLIRIVKDGKRNYCYYQSLYDFFISLLDRLQFIILEALYFKKIYVCKYSETKFYIPNQQC